MIINPYRFATGATDPYWSSVVLLLHGEGSDGSTTITDSSGSPKTMTAQGNAQIDTAQYKFGTASMLFDGTGDYISTPDSDSWHFGSGDFTVECWVRFNSTVGTQTIINQRTSSVVYAPFVLHYAGGWALYLSFNNSTWAAAPTISGGSVSTGTWYFVSFTRSGTYFRLHVNGSQIGSTYTSSSSFTNSANSLSIGGSGSDFGLNGWMDELRITKGVARNPTVVPTEKFPDA